MTKKKTSKTQPAKTEGDGPVTTNSTSMQSTIKNAAHRLAKALEDASEIRIETRYVLTDAPVAGDERGQLLARTVMQLDGDAELLVPMQRNEDGQLVTDREIFDLHMANVKSALEYRADLLSSLLQATSLL